MNSDANQSPSFSWRRLSLSGDINGLAVVIGVLVVAMASTSPSMAKLDIGTLLSCLTASARAII